jgi:hypothetical protein
LSHARAVAYRSRFERVKRWMAREDQSKDAVLLRRDEVIPVGVQGEERDDDGGPPLLVARSRQRGRAGEERVDARGVDLTDGVEQIGPRGGGRRFGRTGAGNEGEKEQGAHASTFNRRRAFAHRPADPLVV